MLGLSSSSPQLLRLLSLAFLPLFYVASFCEVALAGPPIEIRFAAAVVSYKKNFQANQPFDSWYETAGYDMLWRGRVFNNIFAGTEKRVLAGAGKTQNVYKIGGGSCSGTLSPDASLAPVPKVTEVVNGKVKMTIELPHFAANVGLRGFLMDDNQPEQSTCRTATAGVASATCFDPTPRDCYTLEGKIEPGFPTPSDALPLTRYQVHQERAYIEFLDSNPNRTIPFAYSLTDTLYDDKGAVTNIIKIVWTGIFSVSSVINQGAPTPLDPFSLLGFDPNQFTLPPNVTPPNGDPFGGSGGPPTAIRLWIKASALVGLYFVNSLQAVSALPVAVPALAANASSGALGTFDASSGVAILDAEALGAAPADGTLQMRVKAVSPAAARDFKLRVPRTTVKNVLTKGGRSSIQFSLDAGTRRLLEKGSAAKLFIAAKFTPKNGGKPVTFSAKYNIKRRQ